MLQLLDSWHGSSSTQAGRGCNERFWQKHQPGGAEWGWEVGGDSQENKAEQWMSPLSCVIRTSCLQSHPIAPMDAREDPTTSLLILLSSKQGHSEANGNSGIGFSYRPAHHLTKIAKGQRLGKRGLPACFCNSIHHSFSGQQELRLVT